MEIEENKEKKKQSKVTTINIYLPLELKQLFEAEAKSKGMTSNSYGREIILKQLGYTFRPAKWEKI